MMIRQRPTDNRRIARRRILEFVEKTGETCFTAEAVGVEPLTLSSLVAAGLLKAHRELGNLQYYIPDDAALNQEARFGHELIAIRKWSNAAGKYSFTASQVRVHGDVLNNMVAGGVLERRGCKYLIFWKSLYGDWQQTLRNMQEAGKDETE